MLLRHVIRQSAIPTIQQCENTLIRRAIWLATRAKPTKTITTSPPALPLLQKAHSSSSSSTRWKSRQANDSYTRASKLGALKSRAAFKLLEINDKHRLFRPGQTVIDLGYAPGSWSQVALNRTQPGGRVVGIDVIPAQPPRGVNAIQGNFLSKETRDRLKEFVLEEGKGRVRGQGSLGRREENGEAQEGDSAGLTEEELQMRSQGVAEMAQHALDKKDALSPVEEEEKVDVKGEVVAKKGKKLSQKDVDQQAGRVVDVVLSDMCAPWPVEFSTWVRSVSNPYLRMMNTSGNAFRDHAGSMDLCMAALLFSYDTMKTGGHFLCKFYQGAEDTMLEKRLKKLFEKVYRIKPDSSRKESKESYFVGLRRKADVAREDVFAEM